MNYDMKSGLYISTYIDSNTNLKKKGKEKFGFYIELECQILLWSFFSHLKTRSKSTRSDIPDP